MKKSVFMVLLLLLGIAIPTFAQLKVTLNMSSRPDPYLSNWAERKETVIVTVINSGSSSIRAKFDCKINKDGSLTVNTKPEKMKILDIPSGVSQYYGEELVPFDAAKIKDGADQTAIKTGMLPAGSYEFCCSLLDPQDKQLTAPVCKSFTLQSYQAPVLLQPEDKGSVKNKSRPMFRWTAVSPKPNFPVLYQLRVFEVLAGQTPINAFRANRPILERSDIPVTQYQWPADVELPNPKLQHIWTVRALDDKGNAIGEPMGYATPFTFTDCCYRRDWADPCCPPDDVTDNGGGNNFKDKGTDSGKGTGTGSVTRSGTGTGNGSVTSSDEGNDISTNKRIPIAGTSGKGLGTTKRDSISGDSKLVSVEKASKINNSHLRNSILSSFISMPEGMGFAFNPVDEFTLKTKKGSEKYTAVKKEQYEAACKAKVSYMVPEGFAVGVPDPKTFQPSDPSVALFWKLYQNEQGAYIGFPLSLFLSPNGDKQINVAMRKNGGGGNDATCQPFVFRNLPLDISHMSDIEETPLDPPNIIVKDEWNCYVRKSNFIRLPDIVNDGTNPKDTTVLLYDAGDVAGYAVEIIGTTDPVVLDDKTVSKNYVDGFGMVVVERDFKISTEEASALLSGLFAQSKEVKPSIKLTAVKRELNGSDKVLFVGFEENKEKAYSFKGSKIDNVGLAYSIMADKDKNLYAVPIPLFGGTIPWVILPSELAARCDGCRGKNSVGTCGKLCLQRAGVEDQNFDNFFNFIANKNENSAYLQIDGAKASISSYTKNNDGAVVVSTPIGDLQPQSILTGGWCGCYVEGYGPIAFRHDFSASCEDACAVINKWYKKLHDNFSLVHPNNDSDPKNPKGTKPQYVVNPIPGVGVVVKRCCPGNKKIQMSNNDIATSIQQVEKLAQKVVIKEIIPSSDPENPSLSIAYTTADGRSNTILFDIIGLSDDPEISAVIEPVPGVGIVVKRHPRGKAHFIIPSEVVNEGSDESVNDNTDVQAFGAKAKDKDDPKPTLLKPPLGSVPTTSGGTIPTPVNSTQATPVRGKVVKTGKNPGGSIVATQNIVEILCDAVVGSNVDVQSFNIVTTELNKKYFVVQYHNINGSQNEELVFDLEDREGYSCIVLGGPVIKCYGCPECKLNLSPSNSYLPNCIGICNNNVFPPPIPPLKCKTEVISLGSVSIEKAFDVIMEIQARGVQPGGSNDSDPKNPKGTKPQESTQATPVRGKAVKAGSSKPSSKNNFYPTCKCCGDAMTKDPIGHEDECCKPKMSDPKMHYTNSDGTLKYFEYKEDYVITDSKVCEAFGVKELVIAAGIYKVEYPDPSKGGVVQFKLKTPIPAKQIKIKGTFTVEGTNPKGYNCEGPGNSCFFYRDTSSGKKKSPRDSCIFTIAPLMPDSTCLVIEVSFKGTGSPKAAGF